MNASTKTARRIARLIAAAALLGALAVSLSACQTLNNCPAGQVKVGSVGGAAECAQQ
jgi:hypothetical protein